MNEPDDQLHPAEFVKIAIDGTLGLLTRLRVQGGWLSVEQQQMVMAVIANLSDLAATVPNEQPPTERHQP